MCNRFSFFVCLVHSDIVEYYHIVLQQTMGLDVKADLDLQGSSER